MPNYTVTTMLYEWDPKKAVINAAKHGIAFAYAVLVFDDPLHLSIPDGSSSLAEDRWITIGVASGSRHLLVIHTYRTKENGLEVIRIISARKATPKEKKQYEEGI